MKFEVHSSINILINCYLPQNIENRTIIFGQLARLGDGSSTTRKFETRKFDKSSSFRTSGPQQTEARQPGSSTPYQIIIPLIST